MSPDRRPQIRRIDVPTEDCFVGNGAYDAMDEVLDPTRAQAELVGHWENRPVEGWVFVRDKAFHPQVSGRVRVVAGFGGPGGTNKFEFLDETSIDPSALVKTPIESPQTSNPGTLYDKALDPKGPNQTNVTELFVNQRAFRLGINVEELYRQRGAQTKPRVVRPKEAQLIKDRGGNSKRKRFKPAQSFLLGHRPAFLARKKG